MGIKDKLFGGPQNPQQPKIAEEIVNPYYNISQDGTASSSASFTPSAAPNPFMQFQQQQNQPPMQQPTQQPVQQPMQQPPQQPAQQTQPQQNQAPVMNNDDRFDIAQPDTPNGYYAPTAAAPEAPAAEGWTCECGQTGNTFKFCINCGKAKPEPAAAPAEEVTAPVAAPAEAPVPAPADDGWVCGCGQTGNKYQFCINCGAARPEAAPAQIPAPVAAPAPQQAGGTWPCECGFTGNTGEFCLNCGSRKPF